MRKSIQKLMIGVREKKEGKNSISFSIKRETWPISSIEYLVSAYTNISIGITRRFPPYAMRLCLKAYRERFQCPIKKEKYLNYGNDVRQCWIVMLELMISFSMKRAEKDSVKHAKMYIFMGRHLTPFSDGFMKRILWYSQRS
jgi:hypothetical protein